MYLHGVVKNHSTRVFFHRIAWPSVLMAYSRNIWNLDNFLGIYVNCTCELSS